MKDNAPSVKSNCICKQTYDSSWTYLMILDFGHTDGRVPYTRNNNILDLFLNSNPTLVDLVDCKPGFSGHNMVTATCALKPSVQKQKLRKIPLLSKADWSKLKSLMRDYQQKFLLKHVDRTVEELWSDFVSAIDDAASSVFQLKQSKVNHPYLGLPKAPAD